jgi:hypothetical protein
MTNELDGREGQAYLRIFSIFGDFIAIRGVVGLAHAHGV